MAARVGIAVLGVDSVIAGFAVTERAVAAGTERQVRLHAELLRSKVRGFASGRPGPRVITGDYRRNISVNHGRTVGVAGGIVPLSVVRSNSPQGWRLEAGFVGRDVLGRYFNQPAYPHWSPAIDYVEPRLVAALESVVAAADTAGASLARSAGFGAARILRGGL